MSDTLNPGPVHRAARLFGCALAGLALQACSQSLPERLGVPIEGKNHTSAAINYFTVNGSGGPNIGPYGGGGKQNCCVSLPLQWQPGLTVEVEWEKDPTPHDYGSWPEPLFSDAWNARMEAADANNTRHRAVVEVAPYERLGVVNVHFLPCDQVAVAAVGVTPRHPDYPLKFPRKMEVPSVCPTP